MEKPIIEIKGISKKYNIAHMRGGYIALRDIIADVIKRPFSFLKRKTRQVIGLEKKEIFWALKDVNFSVKRGEVIGVIGPNGAGKSTLLKILSQITPPTEGEIVLRGRVGSLLEVGTGFHPELTGRENIFLNGAILGMRKKEIAEKFDEIVAFAGIEQFLDTPVKRYSSGMYVRLAFSVAAHMEPDILIVDEVLAVGDSEFQKKCLGKMEEITRKDGRTIIFVSHNMGAIQSLCSRAVLLKSGHVDMIGPTSEVIDAYLKSIADMTSSDIAKRKNRQGNGELLMQDVYLLDEAGNRTTNIMTGKDMSIVVEYMCKPGIELNNVVIGLGVYSARGEGAFLCHSEMTKMDFGTLKGRGKMVCKIPNIPLVPSTYMISARITSNGVPLDYISDLTSFEVIDGDFFGTGSTIKHSLIYVKHSWKSQSL